MYTYYRVITLLGPPLPCQACSSSYWRARRPTTEPPSGGHRDRRSALVRRSRCDPGARHVYDARLLKGMDIETLRNIHQITKDMAQG